MMRRFSTLGWFMHEAVGALHIDETTNPVIQAWMVDAAEPIDGSRAGGKRLALERGRSAGMADIHPAAKAYVEQQRADDAAMDRCPRCEKLVPKRELDGAYPYDCCNTCYRELPI